jgi:hypothetical protein
VYDAGSGIPFFVIGEFRMRRLIIALAIVGCAIATSSSASAGIFGRKKDCSGAAAA